MVGVMADKATDPGMRTGRPIFIEEIARENATLRSAIAAAIGRLEAIDDGDGRDVEGLIAEVRDRLAMVLEETAGGPVAAPPGDAATPTLDDIELAYIGVVLGKCGGHKPSAARTLGISLKTLYNKLNRVEAAGSHRAVGWPSSPA